MTPQEARAFIDGFCAGGVFFAASFESHQQRKDVFRRIKGELHQAQEIASRAGEVVDRPRSTTEGF